MKALRIIVLTLVTVGVFAACAFGAGYAVRHMEKDTADSASESDRGERRTPSSSGSPSDGTSKATGPTGPSTPTPPPPVMKPGTSGEQVRELQHRLFQMQWLPEQTTGTYDAATQEAVAGWQEKRGLKATGVVDERTWKRLQGMTKTPTHDQKFNILKPGPALLASGSEGDSVRDLQARLKQIQWYAGLVTGSFDAATVEGVRGFQEKRQIPVTGEVDQRTLDRLTAMTSTPSEDEKHNVVPKSGSNTNAALDPRCLTGRVMCIDKSSQTLRWVIDGKVQTTYEVRFGSDELPTREGQFSVQSKSPDHVSTLYHTSMPFAMFFSGGQAVHYSPDFAANGYNGASHGCVNVRDYDGVAWLFGQVNVGDKVIVYWS